MGKKKKGAVAVADRPPVALEVRGATVDPSWSVADPAFAAWLYGPRTAGVSVTTDTALGVPAVWRAVSLISTIVAGLPLKSYRDLGDGQREQVASWVDNPSPYMTPFSFKQIVVAHLAVDGNAFLRHVYGGGGQLIGLEPIPPDTVTVRWDKSLDAKTFDVRIDGKTVPFSAADMTHVFTLTMDGLRGLSPIAVCRDAVGATIAGNAAVARQFANGPMIAGLVTAEDDLPKDEALEIQRNLDNRLTGLENAGRLAMVNRQLKFTEWSHSPVDAQMAELRGQNVEEIARLFGIPKVLLASDGASTWGSGIAELNRGLARYVLPQFLRPVEEAISALLARPRWVEFDMHGLVQSTPEEEIRLLIEQVAAGLLTIDEARQIMNRSPLPAAPAPPEVPAP